MPNKQQVQESLDSFMPEEMLDTAPNAFNLVRFRDKAGRIHLCYDPAEVIPDAGRQRTFRNQTTTKAANTCSNNGPMWQLHEFNGETYREGFTVVHIPGGTAAKSPQAQPRPASKRLW